MRAGGWGYPDCAEQCGKKTYFFEKKKKLHGPQKSFRHGRVCLNREDCPLRVHTCGPFPDEFFFEKKCKNTFVMSIFLDTGGSG